MSKLHYELFLRNWQNGRATVAHIELAVTKGLLTREEADEIMRQPVTPI